MEATGSRVIVYPDKDAEFSLYDIADVHWWTRGCARDHVRRDVQRIADDPCAMWFCGGDYGDWISVDDARFDPEAFDETLTVNDLSRFSASLASSIVSLFASIKGKCLGFCMGNHELKYMTKRQEMYVHDAICNALGVVNMRYSGWTDLYFVHERRARKVTVRYNEYPTTYEAKLRVFLHHGAGAPNTAGGKINRLKQLVDMVNADLVMMGHLHEQIAKPFVRLEPDAECRNIKQRVTMALITGSYLLTYAPDFTSYGEQKAYSPTTLGATRARYRPNTMRLIVENAADGVGKRSA